MKMEVQKKGLTSRYNEMGSGPPGKSQVILVSIGNKQWTPPPPKLEKVGPHLEPRKMIVFFGSKHWTSVKQVGDFKKNKSKKKQQKTHCQSVYIFQIDLNPNRRKFLDSRMRQHPY